MKTLHVLAFNGLFWTDTPGAEWSANESSARRFDLSNPTDAHEAESLCESSGGRLFPADTAPKSITLRLALTVTYQPHGVALDELRERLENVATGAINDGLITGDSAAEVETWGADVLEVGAGEPASLRAAATEARDFLRSVMETKPEDLHDYLMNQAPEDVEHRLNVALAATAAPVSASLATAARAYMEAVRDCDAYPMPQNSEERAELAERKAAKRDAETDLCAALAVENTAPAPLALIAAATEARDYCQALIDAKSDPEKFENRGEVYGLRVRLDRALAAAESAPAAPVALVRASLETGQSLADFIAGKYDMPEEAANALSEWAMHARSALRGEGPPSAPIGSTLAADLYADLYASHGGDMEALIERLDEMTHDAQIANASDVNNQGAEAQIAALLAAGVRAETIRRAAGGN